MNDIIDILVNFGGGKGGEASGTVVRFLLPSFFWLVLVVIAGSEWRRKDNRRDLIMVLAALAGTARELLMFLAEYGSSRGHFNFDVFYRYYPPLEHAATLLVGIFIASSFMRYGGSGKRYQAVYLPVGVVITFFIYLATAIEWPIYLLAHPKISFALYWGDLAFRLAAFLILGTALTGFVMDRMRGSRVSFPLIAGIGFLFLDELLMIVNIATSEQYVAIFAPVRHNLHIWAIPFFIATYWTEMKFQSLIYEEELEKQHRELSELNATLERRVSDAALKLNRRDWFNSGLNQLNAIVRGDSKPQDLADKTLSFLIRYLGAAVGAFYAVDAGDGSLLVISTFAITGESRLNKRIAPGEGLAGQVLVSRSTIRLTPVPHGYLPTGSALGESSPLDIVALPVSHNEQLVAVLELGSFKNFSDDDSEFLRLASEVIGIAVSVNHSRQQVNELLDQTQAQAEELRVQQEELQQTNEELAERARMLVEQHSRVIN